MRRGERDANGKMNGSNGMLYTEMHEQDDGERRINDFCGN